MRINGGAINPINIHTSTTYLQCVEYDVQVTTVLHDQVAMNFLCKYYGNQ